MIVGLSGGLGNQLFQYAMAECLEESVSKIKFDTRLCAHGKGCGLDYLNLSYQRISRLSSFAWRVVLKFFKRMKDLQLETTPFAFDEIDCRKKYVYGCWQNVAYFCEKKSILQEKYRYNGVLTERQQHVMEEMSNCNAVVVHVRRGDYLNATDVYRTIDMEYYQKAMQYYREKYKEIHFYIFSDDIEWCKKYFQYDEYTFIDKEISNSQYVDFEMMKNGKYFIIANSTFSWWASWLADYSGKEMIAPEKWFVSEKNNMRIQKALLEEYIIM